MSDALDLRVFTSPAHAIPGPGNRTFSPITSTLLIGPSEVAVVDTQFIKREVDALIHEIASTGKKLVAILLTHAHGDHYFGSARLVDRFPGARVISTGAVAAHIAAMFDTDVSTFTTMFGDEIVVPAGAPNVIVADAITVDGTEVRLIDVGQGDIENSAVVYVTSLAAVIAGDVAYNGIHQMLGLGGPAEWEQWIASVDAIERLKPRIVVAGHKNPELPDDDAERILNETRSYIHDFATAAREAHSAEAIVESMRMKYPAHGNSTTLHFSAHMAMKRKIARAR